MISAPSGSGRLVMKAGSADRTSAVEVMMKSASQEEAILRPIPT